MKEFGVKRRDMHAALQSFRSGPHEYPELKPLALYHRHQRSREVSGLQHLPLDLYVSHDLHHDVFSILSYIASSGKLVHPGPHRVSRQLSSHMS